MPDLFIVRHGLSSYNLENRFTGWLDVPLCEEGIQQAKTAAIQLKPYRIDRAFTSNLKRAIDTLQIIRKEHGDLIPVMKTALLDERNYGALQGLNKSEVAKQYGEEQVLLWRRSYDATPPGGESLKDTYNRVIPFFDTVICKELSNGKNVLIVAHGNSIRCIIKKLDGISDTAVINLQVDTGKIYNYTFDGQLKVISKTIL